ncbi:MAG TPA: hypothetical protein VN408_22970 [Actinoplanes sp.]|nr:hypothetical protein [Actinoplanes sp.]
MDAAVAASQPLVRTAGDLLAVAEERWAARQQQKREREAAERRRREEAAAAAREKRLDELARNPVRTWNQVDELIATNVRRTTAQR